MHLRSRHLIGVIAGGALAASVLGATGTPAAIVRVGPVFTLSESSELFADAVDLDTAADGSFVVVWSRRVPESGYRGVYARRFSELAAPFGGEFRVDAEREDTFVGATAPMVAVQSSDGAFAATWFWDDLEVLARTYDAAGLPLGPETVVPTIAVGDHLYPDIAASGTGFVSVWEHNTGSNATSDTFSRRLETDGSPLDPQLTVSGAFPRGDHYPRVAARSDESFIVAWSNFESGVASRALARIYAGDNQPVGTTLVVAEQTSAVVSRPTVEAADDGSFVVAWTQRNGNSDPGSIMARRYDDSGVPLADEFVVATEPAGLTGYPGLAVFGDGAFVVAWSQYNVPQPKLYGRGFSSDGGPMGARFLIGDLGATRPAVSANRDAGFVVAWAGRGGRGQRFTLDPVCGDANADGEFLATDALLVLNGSVGLVYCDPCICNTSGGGTVTATDALRVLQTSVGTTVPFDCPACS
jgi:hypothetical protein